MAHPFKVGDRVKTSSLIGNPVRHDQTGTVKTAVPGQAMLIVLDASCDYQYPEVLRTVAECQLIAPAEPTDAELAAAYRAGREAGGQLLARGYVIQLGSVTAHFDNKITSIFKPEVKEMVVKSPRIEL